MSMFIKQTFGEELANSITHGVAAIVALVLLPIAVVYADRHSGGGAVTCGVAVFGISVFLMFLMSALYHAMPPESDHKRVFKILDHIFIYVAIAGSYTPIALAVIGGWKAVVLLAVQWAAVLFGILYKSLIRQTMPKTSLTIYLVMGWTAILVIPELFRRANPVLFWLIVAGGLAYSAGSYFYAKKAFRYHHTVWHLFVFVGAASHYVAIGFFLAPPSAF